MALPSKGTIVKIRTPEIFVMVVDPATRKATETPQLFECGEDGELKIITRSTPGYLQMLSEAGTLTVPGFVCR